MTMRGKFTLFVWATLFIIFFSGIVSAGNYTEIITYQQSSTTSQTLSDLAQHAPGTLKYINVMAIENWPHVYSFEAYEHGDATNPFSMGEGGSTCGFTAKIGAKTIGHGVYVFATSTNNLNDRISYYFSDWDIGSSTGPAQILITYDIANCAPTCPRQQYGGNAASPVISDGGSNGGVGISEHVSHQTDWYTEWKAEIQLNETNYGNGTYNVVELFYDRNVDGIDYGSKIDVRTTAGDWIYINNDYAASGTEETLIDRYPAMINVSFGYPTAWYTWTREIIGDNPEQDLIPITPTPTPTATPTATPTPVPELCGYWTLAVNTSNIIRNGYVQGTLTETDPSNRFDMIDWYIVSPDGQEFLMYHYVYDPGLFGLGAGWFEVTKTGTAYASSEAAAKQNDIKFTTSGGAHHLRAKIYDDVSLLPMVYHDYDLVCTLDQVVYVGETTQASNTLGINVKECDTSAMLTGVNIGVYDYLTGQWSNKTSEYGGTTYFNVVPGHNVRVVANKTGWLNSDTDYTIPATPYLYEVCLKRPLVDIEDKSYVFFNVRDSVTLAGLFQANIQLSDGQIQNTLPSGYAGFSVNDSETYIYTVTKPGYQSFSDSFTITTDTTIPVKLVQISPTPTLTYPITTLPTVTITGTTTGTVTPTGTGVWSNTTATLSPTDKTYKTTKGLDIWYMNLETLSGLLFVAAVFGAIGLISDSMGRRRRR
jgi:hypothetical protein